MPRVLNIWATCRTFNHGWNYRRDGLLLGAVYIGRKNVPNGLPESKWHNPN